MGPSQGFFYCVLCQAKCRIIGTKQLLLQRIPQGNDTIHKIFQIITAEEKIIFVCWHWLRPACWGWRLCHPPMTGLVLLASLPLPTGSAGPRSRASPTGWPSSKGASQCYHNKKMKKGLPPTSCIRDAALMYMNYYTDPYELLYGSVWITIRICMNYYTDPYELGYYTDP